MVTLITMLLVALIVGIVSSIGTLALVVLSRVHVNTQPKKDEEEPGMYTIPLSHLGGLGGARPITQAEIDQAREAIMKSRCVPPEKPDAYVPNEGSYI